MHMEGKFVFNLLECGGIGYRIENPKIVVANGKNIISGLEESCVDLYDPFEFDNLIPEFIRMSENIVTGVNVEKAIKNWMREWGPLYSDVDKHTVDIFKYESTKFYQLWGLYKAIVNGENRFIYRKEGTEDNRDNKYRISFHKGDDTYQLENWFSEINGLNTKINDYTGLEYNDKGTFVIILDKDKNEFDQIKKECMKFFFNQIQKYTNRANLQWGSMRHEKKENQSNFKIRQVLTTENLIDAIYLQFYILFSENEKKICTVCNRSFIPERKDKKYCSNSCKLTAKSRRYRIRKEKLKAIEIENKN